MVGIARRIAELYAAKVNALLDRVEDPREMLDYSHAQQQELLTNVRRGMVEVSAGAARAQAQADDLDRSADRWRERAEQAVAAGREDLARQALARRSQILARAAESRQQQAALHADEERLAAAAQRLQAKVDSFAVRKQTISSDYTTARLTADVTGVSEEMGDAGLTAHRAAGTTARVRAEAEALEHLLAPGGLADTMFPAGPEHPEGPDQGSHLSGPELQAELDQISTQAAVDEELARIKARLAGGG